MKKALVVLCFAVLGPMLVPAAASSQVHACDAGDTLCVRHCLAYHRGLDRILCLVTHNIQH
jgi:hypothetical protein